jgi:phage-related protein
VARTQAVFYRDEHGAEPVDEFIEVLPPKHAAKIDEYIEEYLNGRPTDAPPPEYPISSQLDGELRELRVRFANTRYRILYQRSDNLVLLLHAEFRQWCASVEGEYGYSVRQLPIGPEDAKVGPPTQMAVFTR